MNTGPNKFIITFGSGQRFGSQRGTHVIIEAESEDLARQIMYDVVGNQWCTSYPLSPQTQAEIIDKWRSREISLEEIQREVGQLSMEDWKRKTSYV